MAGENVTEALRSSEGAVSRPLLGAYNVVQVGRMLGISSNQEGQLLDGYRQSGMSIDNLGMALTEQRQGLPVEGTMFFDSRSGVMLGVVTDEGEENLMPRGGELSELKLFVEQVAENIGMGAGSERVVMSPERIITLCRVLGLGLREEVVVRDAIWQRASREQKAALGGVDFVRSETVQESRKNVSGMDDRRVEIDSSRTMEEFTTGEVVRLVKLLGGKVSDAVMFEGGA